MMPWRAGSGSPPAGAHSALATLGRARRGQARLLFCHPCLYSGLGGFAPSPCDVPLHTSPWLVYFLFSSQRACPLSERTHPSRHPATRSLSRSSNSLHGTHCYVAFSYARFFMLCLVPIRPSVTIGRINRHYDPLHKVWISQPLCLWFSMSLSDHHCHSQSPPIYLSFPN